jgi:hypothetical protein
MRQYRITEQSRGRQIGPWNSTTTYAVGRARSFACVPHLRDGNNETCVIVSQTGALQVNGSNGAATAGAVYPVDAGDAHDHDCVSTSPGLLMTPIRCPADKVLPDGRD